MTDALVELEHRAERHCLELRVSPASPIEQLALIGNSCEAAFAVALEAAIRCVEVHPQFIVSAAVQRGPHGPVLGGVTNCRDKALAVREECPGSTLLIVPCADETSEVNGLDHVRTLPVGTSLDDLLGIMLPRVGRTPEELQRQRDLAAREYGNQNYDDARGLYEELILELDRLPDSRRYASWRFEALLRIGGAAMHAGNIQEADSLFANAERERATFAPMLAATAITEMKVSFAGSLIDQFRPEEAARLTEPLRDEWERKLSADPDGEDRQMALVAVLGAERRVRLLSGDPSGAVTIQHRLLHLVPPHEEARSWCDLGECLRRTGDLAGAVASFEQADARLDNIWATASQLQTKAFIEYYRGLIALAGGSDPAGSLENLEQTLPCNSAAYRRLRLLRLAFQLRDGDESALVDMVSTLAAPQPLSRWLGILTLVRCTLLRPDLTSISQAAARGLESMKGLFDAHPLLDDARVAFTNAAGVGAPLETASSALLRYTAY